MADRVQALFDLVVVEDDAVDAAAVRRAATRSYPQIPVTVYPTAAEALADQRFGADGDQPVLVIVDINLPGTGGHELLRRLRGLERPPPVVVLTTSADRRDRQTAWRNGAGGYFLKPIEAAAWPPLIARILDYWADCQWGRDPR